MPTRTAEIYDRDTESWSEVAPLAQGRLHHRATLLDSGEVLVTGGRDLVFEDITNAWIPLDDIPGGGTGAFTYEGRYGGGAILLPDGHVVVVGGIGWGGIDAREPLISEGPFPP